MAEKSEYSIPAPALIPGPAVESNDIAVQSATPGHVKKHKVPWGRRAHPPSPCVRAARCPGTSCVGKASHAALPRSIHRGDNVRDAPGTATVSSVAKSLEAQVRELAEQLGLPDVELRRSPRRRTTVSAFREGGRVVISAPVRISSAELLPLAQELLAKMVAQRLGSAASDSELAARAERLLSRWLPQDFPRPSTVRWSQTQTRVWGTCVNSEGSIRISSRLRGMPEYVLDYVLLHELAHLMHSGHGEEFESLLQNYPQRDRARGFLDGVSWRDQNGSDAAPATQLGLFGL